MKEKQKLLKEKVSAAAIKVAEATAANKNTEIIKKLIDEYLKAKEKYEACLRPQDIPGQLRLF